jgi:hypothetical protein
MIFDTLLPHATFLTQNDQIGEKCFVLDHCRFGVDEFRQSFEQNIRQNKPKTKLNLPILLSGKIIRAVPGRFQGNNPGNVSSNTFKKKKKKDDFPEKWFPWLHSKNHGMDLGDFLSLMKSFNEIPPESIYQLFDAGGTLYTFDIPQDKKTASGRKTADLLGSLERMVAISVYQPVKCKGPTLAVHSLLALNALNESAGLFGETKDPALIRKELFKFALLFWMLNQIGSLRITTDSRVGFEVEAKTFAEGNIDDISNLPLLLDAGHFHLGVHTDQIDASNPVLKKFMSLIREDISDRIALNQKVFTAPATGKAATNAFRDDKNLSVLTPEIRLGFDRKAVNRLLPAYSTLILDRSFSIGHTSLTYYVFPEDVSKLSDYLLFLSDMISQIKGYRQQYFDQAGKSSTSKKAREEKEAALARIRKLRKDFWEKCWSKFRLSNLMFAFEEDVGSNNQKQFAWTSVYRDLPSARAFLFLEMVNDPEEFGRLASILQNTSRDLSEGWKEKEIKALFNRYFLSGCLDQIVFWIRWRKYLSRRNLSQAPFEPGLWEKAMSLIIQMKAMSTLTVEADCSGKQLLAQLGRRRKSMDEENKSEIKKYLFHLFLTVKAESTEAQVEKGTARVISFIESMAGSYMTFIDTGSDGWQTIVDGLVCGWALKQICLKIRKDDYKAVIGGKSLVRHTPSQLRTMSIDLLGKAERAGTRPWNVQAPLERMFAWSQKGPHMPEVQLFMDAVSLGFARYESRDEAAEPQNATEDNGSVQ